MHERRKKFQTKKNERLVHSTKQPKHGPWKMNEENELGGKKRAAAHHHTKVRHGDAEKKRKKRLVVVIIHPHPISLVRKWTREFFFSPYSSLINQRCNHEPRTTIWARDGRSTRTASQANANSSSVKKSTHAAPPLPHLKAPCKVYISRRKFER